MRLTREPGTKPAWINEVLSLIGGIALYKGQPVVHTHIVAGLTVHE